MTFESIKAFEKSVY